MQRHIYITSYSKDGGIYHTVLENGKLAFSDRLSLEYPLYTIADGKDMYAALDTPFEDGSSGIVSFRINGDGSFDVKSLSAPQPTHGICACHLCRHNGKIYAANYSSGSAARLPDKLVAHSGKSVDADRQGSPHCHYINPSPDGRYLLVCDLGTDEIITYDKDLVRVASAKTPLGNGPRHLAFSPDGEYVYCACELSSTLSVFSYRDGFLTFESEVSTLPEGFDGVSYPAAIRYVNGRVYVSNRGHNSVSVFEAAGKSVSLVLNFDCGGNWPRDFDIFGEYLICTNERSDNVTVFRLKGDTFEQTDELNGVNSPLCVTQVII